MVREVKTSMHPTSELRPAKQFIAAVLSGLLCTASVAPYAFAQGKTPKTQSSTAKGSGAQTTAAKGTATKLTDAQKKDAAKKHYSDGKKKLDAKDYDGALTEFRAANDLMAAPVTEQKMALCLDQLGRTQEAIAEYELFLSHADQDKQKDLISESRDRLNALKNTPLPVRVSSDPPKSTVEVDGAAQIGVTPLDAKLTPGHHKIRVTALGYEPAEQELDVKPGDKLPDMSFTLVKKAEPMPIPMPPPTAPPPTAATTGSEQPAGPRSNVPAYVTLGIAGAGAIVGVIFGVKALNDKKAFDDGPTSTKADDAERNALIADMAFGVAITLGVTGTVLLLSNKSPAPQRGALQPATRTMMLTPVVGPHSGGAAALWRF